MRSTGGGNGGLSDPWRAARGDGGEGRADDYGDGEAGTSHGDGWGGFFGEDGDGDATYDTDFDEGDGG